MDAPPRPSFGEACRVWLRIGVLGFGGPAGQIALMHRELVERRRWVDEDRFLHALSYCTLLPGPEAQQLATYLGWLLFDTRGALAAGTLFVLPGALVLLATSALYVGFQAVPAMGGVFFGLKAVVVALVLEALVRVGRRALLGPLHRGIAAAGFLGLWFGLPFPVVVLSAALVGLVIGRWRPGWLPGANAGKAAAAPAAPSVLDGMAARGELAHTAPSVVGALRRLATWLAVWIGPLALVAWLFGDPYAALATFMSQAALVTFGGAYAVLAYVAQQAVEAYGWLRPGEMVDGLGLAETTPGPLILVLQFVGFVAGYRSPGPLGPWAGGTLGAAVTLWATFAPCFLWILVGAPWVEAVRANRALASALRAVTAVVVGVILHLALWFALHTWFGHLDGGVPTWSTLDPWAVALSVAAAVALMRFHVGLGWVLLGGVLIGGLVRG